MTLAELKTMLESVNDGAFESKVVYRAFPVDAAPDLPFICYLETETDNFFADNVVFKKIQHIDIELYTEFKDKDTENALETVLNDNLIVWEKFEEYIESEDCFMITYEITITE